MLKRVISITLAFIGLLVGAGFATGQETIQYFVSHGSIGIAGAVLAGLLISIGGMLSLQLGSYFLADEHNEVFQDISKKWVARFMDVSVMITLFSLGFVMLAGAGSTFNQQFGWPTWVGSTVMLALVIASGFLDINKVSNVIGALTPAMIIAVIIAFTYMMFNLPDDLSSLNDVAVQAESPISPWWLSAINYAGLVEIMAISMVLVIGGSYLDPRESSLGGLVGGIAYTVLLVMISVTLFLGADKVEGSSVPNLTLFEEIHPVMAIIAVFIVYAMIYNSAIGMFYALGRRLSAGKQSKFRLYFIITTLVGYAISFIGFGSLMAKVYPILGYLGLLLIAVLIIFYIRDRRKIASESKRRNKIRDLAYRKHHPDKEFTDDHAAEMEKLMGDSQISDDYLSNAVQEEVTDSLVQDDSVDFSEEDAEQLRDTDTPDSAKS
ncbi:MULTISPECIES: YkvI family membrane protein [Corynebacterium]|uniref:YkvI family membrane protein n=1 Tax=Corynebacterium TaxID=1716 RepID=UPI00124D0EA4|nr:MULTISPECIES: hypothetical protein [Corynebacterium]